MAKYAHPDSSTTDFNSNPNSYLNPAANIFIG
jgi:hypothetical protein